MTSPMISISKDLLELIEQTWHAPDDTDPRSLELQGLIRSGRQDIRDALARKRDQNDPAKATNLLPLPDVHQDPVEPASPMYTGEQMQEYAQANIREAVVAWRFHRPASRNEMYGLDCPEVNRLIIDERQALEAASAITHESPGSLTPLKTNDLALEIRKALIKVSSLELYFFLVSVEDEQTKVKTALAALWQEIESIRVLNHDAVNALVEISAIEDELYGGDWDEIERARDIAKAALATCQAPIEPFSQKTAYKTFLSKHQEK